MNLIQLENIKKKLGNNDVLKGVNFVMDEGQIVSIIGKSGSGKTTLIRVLGTIYRQDEGIYLLSGEDISRLSERQCTKRRSSDIGIVFQDYNVFDDLSVKDNIILPFVFNKRRYNEELFRELLEDLELTGLDSRKTASLSGGEKQRVSIARAMLMEPKVILADEPTGNLDSANAEKVINMLIDTARKRKQAVVVVTHDMDIANKTDVVYTMVDGKL